VGGPNGMAKKPGQMKTHGVGIKKGPKIPKLKKVKPRPKNFKKLTL